MQRLRRKLLGGSLLVLVQEMCGSTTSRAGESSEFVAQVSIMRIEFNPAQPTWLWQLPTELRVFDGPPSAAPSELDRRFAHPVHQPPVFRSGRPVTALGIGPVLDAPDTATLALSTQSNRRFVAKIDYTQVRREGAELRQNLPWRPAIEILFPDTLRPGHFEIEVTWHSITCAREDANESPCSLRQLTAFSLT